MHAPTRFDKHAEMSRQRPDVVFKSGSTDLGDQFRVRWMRNVLKKWSLKLHYPKFCIYIYTCLFFFRNKHAYIHVCTRQADAVLYVYSKRHRVRMADVSEITTVTTRHWVMTVTTYTLILLRFAKLTIRLVGARPVRYLSEVWKK